MIRSFLDKNFPALLMGLICIVLVLSIGVPRAASFAAPAAGLILLIAYTIGRGHFLKLRLGEFLFVAAIVGLAALSSLWAIDPPFALERAGKIGGILIFGLFFVEAARQITTGQVPVRFVQSLCLLYALACALVALELVWDFKLYRFIRHKTADDIVYTVFMNRSIVVMTSLFLPLMLLLAGSDQSARLKKIIGALMTLALGAALFLTESQSAQLFFLISLFFLFAFPARCRIAWIALGVAVMALALVAPWLALTLFKLFPYDNEAVMNEGLMIAASIPHRLEVWNFVATETLKSPLYGRGIEAIRYIHSETWLKLPNTNNMLHPHNAVLQIWVEFGVIGTLLACGLFGYILRTLWLSPLPARKYGLAVLIGLLAVMSTGYGLWQSWQLGLIMTLAGFTAFAARAGKNVSGS
jgi:exopolysaccharide production protein ExoQ